MCTVGMLTAVEAPMEGVAAGVVATDRQQMSVNIFCNTYVRDVHSETTSF